MILVFCGLALTRILRKPSTQHVPILTLIGIIATCSAMGLWGADPHGYWTLAALLLALMVNTVPILFSAWTDRAWLQARYRHAYYLSIVAWVMLPTAAARLRMKMFRAFLQTETGAMPIRELGRQLLDSQQSARDIQLYRLARQLEDASIAVFALGEQRARLLDTLSPEQLPVYGAAPNHAGSLVVTALCQRGRVDEAAIVVAAMEDPPQANLRSTIADAFRNRARITLLSACGERDILARCLGPQSTLRNLFTKYDRHRLQVPSPAEPGEWKPTTPMILARVRAALTQESHLSTGLSSLGRPAMWTGVLLAVNILAYAGLVLLQEDSTLGFLRAGACVPILVSEGQYWRLFSSMFLHGAWFHLLLNAAMLVYFGNFLERLLGGGRTLTIYLFAGLTGSLAFVWLPEGALMVGASGAIFGLLGAALVLLQLRAGEYPRNWAERHSRLFKAFLVINLALGFVVEIIALSAHIGGLLGGAAMAWWLLKAPSHNRLTTGVFMLGWVVAIGWTGLALSQSLVAPAATVMPFHTLDIQLQSDPAHQVQMHLPITWLDLSTERSAEDNRRHGPLRTDGFGFLWETRIICRWEQQADVGFPAGDDGTTLAHRLNRLLSEGDGPERFEGAPNGFAVRWIRDAQDSLQMRAVRFYPQGELILTLAYRHISAEDARSLSSAILADTLLTGCGRSTPSPGQTSP